VLLQVCSSFAPLPKRPCQNDLDIRPAKMDGAIAQFDKNEVGFKYGVTFLSIVYIFALIGFCSTLCWGLGL
jgi:hypothetical protein